MFMFTTNLNIPMSDRGMAGQYTELIT